VYQQGNDAAFSHSYQPNDSVAQAYCRSRGSHSFPETLDRATRSLSQMTTHQWAFHEQQNAKLCLRVWLRRLGTFAPLAVSTTNSTRCGCWSRPTLVVPKALRREGRTRMGQRAYWWMDPSSRRKAQERFILTPRRD
jgi:hypothetical protein